MNQITMSRMNLNHPEASIAGTTCSLPESVDDRLNPLCGSGLGQGIMIGKSHGARTHDIAPSIPNCTRNYQQLLAPPVPRSRCND
jgi:hypothetical protein